MVLCLPGQRVYFVDNRLVDPRIGGALFARKESNCIQVVNNTGQKIHIGLYYVTSIGSTYSYEPIDGTLGDVESDTSSKTWYFKRPDFKGSFKGDRELVATFTTPAGKFIRRVISGSYSGLGEAPNSFFITSNKIEARKNDLSSIPEANAVCNTSALPALPPPPPPPPPVKKTAGGFYFPIPMRMIMSPPPHQIFGRLKRMHRIY